MTQQQYYNARLVTDIKIQARAKAKKRLTMITSYIEIIVEHCVKLNAVPSNEYVNHWRKEIAIALYNISKIKKPFMNQSSLRK